MISFKLIIGVLFALLITGISVLAVISLQNSQASDKAADLVEHTHQVLDKVQELASFYKEIQLESNGFVVTRDPAFLVPYASAKTSTLESIKRLQFLTQDNEKQQRRIDTLLNHVNGLVHFSDSLHHLFDGPGEPSRLCRSNLNTQKISNECRKSPQQHKSNGVTVTNAKGKSKSEKHHSVL